MKSACELFTFPTEEIRKRFMDYVSDTQQPWKDAVLTYLKTQGEMGAVSPMANYDLLTEEPIRVSLSCWSDGEYYWRSDLPYYVEKYNLSLDEAFIKKAVAFQGALEGGRIDV